MTWPILLQGYDHSLTFVPHPFFDPSSMLPKHSDIDIPTKSGIRIIYLTTIATILSLLVALPLIKFDVSIKAKSIIRPAAEVSVIRSASSGTIKKVYAHENKFVKKGDLLFALDPEVVNERARNMQERHMTLVLLSADARKCIDQSFQITKTKKSFRTNYYRQSFETFHHRVTEAQLSLDHARQLFDRQRKLFLQRVIAPSDYEKVEFELKLAESTLYQVEELQRNEWESQLKSYHDQIKEIESALELNRLEQNSLEIRAPITGTILGLTSVYAGSIVAANQELTQLSPDTSLCVLAYVKPKDVGLLKEGMSIRYQVDAFSFYQWGLANGRILAIPPDVVVLNNEPVFQVQCSLETEYLALKTGYKGKLRKGMTLQARFIVCQRTAWDLLQDTVNDWINPYMDDKRQSQ